MGQADWIGARLAPFKANIVTSVVPGGFEAYLRLLHPVEIPGRDHGDLVRWNDVAAWSGMPLRPYAEFHSIALPPDRPVVDPPWKGQGPQEGSLFPPDAEVLAEILRAHTTTPESCWFCVWDGYGWDNTVAFTSVKSLTSVGEPALRVPDPVPAEVRRGPRVRLPAREYLLYTGPTEEVLATVHLTRSEQTPNLWWPADRAWCVATEIDLPWTYVGGTAALIELLMANEQIETLPALADEPCNRVEEWVARWVEAAVDDLLETGEATVVTSRGTVRAWLERPTRLRRGALRTKRITDNGSASGWRRLNSADEQALRREVSGSLTMDVIALA